MISVTFLTKEQVANLMWMGRGVPINQRRMLGFRGRKRIIVNSPEYKAFVEDMTWTFKTQFRRPTFERKVVVIVAFTRGVRSNRVVDIDAYSKQILDALQHAGVYTNDDQVNQLLISDAGRNDGDDVLMLQVAEIEGVDFVGKFASGS